MGEGDNISIAVDPDLHLSAQIAEPEDFVSETTSIASAIAKGRLENGRRYQNLKEDDYWSPSDEQQFEAFEMGHLVCLMLDHQRPNPLHRAPVNDSVKHILDIGTGKGNWAIDAADFYPNATVRGVDLFPPPSSWVPPNCVFEVDDINRDWTWRDPFDFIHIRQLLGAFDPAGWEKLYKQCYKNLTPGGWIEQMEFDIRALSDDGSLDPTCALGNWGDNFIECANRAGRSLTTQKTMRAAIEAAGFVDVQEQLYKVPIGPWPKDPLLKEVGQVNYYHWVTGLEGYAMWLLTHYGAPVPWTTEEVEVYLAKVRTDLKKPSLHAYGYARRVWARKPLEDEKVETNGDSADKVVAKE
ncbi:hypothetical protein N7495_006307 [Penicillium taxi]|uniref:uncharacterized protein n=1 Tax=Penicillium taxi TaxID=168475 RepID=UPI002545388B|nr:uncharacterized protein N7495_006307 [Penicillium taxi]KAJ5894616.1 hypothetical protein N7495_006307 [Penicillium taxi]